MSEDTPKTTLTQRRNQIMSEKDSGASKLSKDKLSGASALSGMGGKSGPGKKAKSADAGKSRFDTKSIARIFAWILVVAFLGIGSALVATSLLSSSEESDTDQNETTTEDVDINSETEENADDTSLEEDEDDSSLTGMEDMVDETDENAGDPEDTSEDDPNEDETPTTPTTSSGDLGTFGTDDRSRAASGSANDLNLRNFQFEANGDLFYFSFTNSGNTGGGLDPAIELSYDEEDNIVLKFTNVASDTVTGNNNTGGRTVEGINGISGWETENNGATSTYKFLTTRSDLPSRVILDETAGTIRFEVDI